MHYLVRVKGPPHLKDRLYFQTLNTMSAMHLVIYPVNTPIQATASQRTAVMIFTYAARGQQPLRLFGRVAVRVHRFQHVQAKRERNDGLGTRAHDHALDPQPHERDERPERLHDVRVVGPGLGYHAAQLGVTVRAHLEIVYR